MKIWAQNYEDDYIDDWSFYLEAKIIISRFYYILTRRPLGVNSGYLDFCTYCKIRNAMRMYITLWSTPHVQPSIQLSIQISNKQSNCTQTWTSLYSSAVSSYQTICIIKTIFSISGAVYRNAVKFTYIGYNLMLFRTV